VPSEVTVGTISTRFEFPIFLSVKFLRRLLWLLLTFPKHRGSLFLSYLSIVIGAIQPKIIVTGADNNTALAAFAHSHPNILTIFVQTALRDTTGGFPTGIRIPNYYALGESENLIFNSLQVQADSYKPWGSLKLGYALADPTPKLFHHIDVCFVSNHRPEQATINSSILWQMIEETSDLLFEHTCKYAEKFGLTLRILAKSREPEWHEKELRHYERLSQDFPFELVVAEKSSGQLDPYYALFASEIVINNASTLGFEALAIGKKVLFGASMTTGLIDRWGISVYFDQVPSLITVDQTDFLHFEKKLNKLRSLSAAEYHQQTADKTRSLVTQDPRNPPHHQLEEIIRNRLLS
tara:strand:- start:2242 stop:3294 length:1053 start_codon:yes stop_codon:yes gene_type:complete